MTPDEIKTLVLEFAGNISSNSILCVQCGSDIHYADGKWDIISTLESLSTYQSLIAKEATESAYLAAYSDLEKAVRSGCGVAEALAAIDALSERSKP